MDFEAPISEVMNTNVIAIGKDSSVLDACRLMAEKKVGTVVIVESGKPTAVLNERDIISQVILNERNAKTLPVKDIAPSDFVVESADNTILDASLKMNENGLKRLPIVDETGRLVGILSSSDIVHILAEFTLFENFSKD